MTQKITSLISSAPQNDWYNSIDYFQKNINSDEYHKNDIQYIIQELQRNIGKQKTSQASNWLLLGLLVNAKNFINNAKQKGVLRASQNDFASSGLLKEIIENAYDKLHLTDDIKSYFKSLASLYIICEEARQLKEQIVKELKERKGNLLREVLVKTDLHFMLQATTGQLDYSAKIDDSINFIFPDFIAEACSYIVFLYHKHVGERQPLPDNNMDFSLSHADKLLAKATKIRFIVDAEVKIDFYGYKVLINNKDNHIYELHPPSDEFEKARRLGYVGVGFQQIKRGLVFQHHKENFVKEMAKIYNDKFGKEMITLFENPFPRYVLKFYDYFLKEQKIFGKFLFPEEIMQIDGAVLEWNIEPQELLDFEVAAGVCMFDIIRFQRFINLSRWALFYYCESRMQTEIHTTNQSFVPYLELNLLKQILDMVLDKSSEKLINFLSYNFKNKSGFFDIMYQPILKIEEGFVSAPHNIIGNTNILRNSLQLSTRRFYEDGTDDPLPKLVYDALFSKNFQVKSNFPYKWNGKQGEIDNIALCDGYLFVFECKNSNLPCDAHELRTSYDYIIKASNQLQRFKHLYQEDKFKQYLSQNLGWKIADATLVTSIIMSNRMFNGLRIKGHSVRTISEITNFIDSGKINLIEASFSNINEKTICLWKSNRFTANDLYEYLENDIFHKPTLESFIPEDEVCIFGNKKFIKKTFAFNIEGFIKNHSFQE
ncbi:MAG: hypothetical protein K0U45_03295 [Alphaproteobacteria bacterium]|nr:hypothetical protein [Alphaproteobacteria bacterium]